MKRNPWLTALALIIPAMIGCSLKQAVSTAFPSALNIEESPLKSAPASDPLVFIPEQGTQDELWAKHQQLRDLPIPNNATLYDGMPAFSVSFGNEDLVGLETYTIADGTQGRHQKVTIQVIKEDQLILSIDAGDISPIQNLRGLWTYPDHWVMEVAHVSTGSATNETPLEPSGEILVDGRSVNQSNGYDQAFGFQLLQGKPFYFFQQNRKIGISYDGGETHLDYDQILHYQCCSAAELNPRVAPDMLSFFAQRLGKWYFVEIGFFE